MCYTVNALDRFIPKKPLVIGWFFGIVGGMKYKKGDGVFVKRSFGSVFTAKIIYVSESFWGTKYTAQWTVHNLSTGSKHLDAGILKPWHIIGLCED